MIKGLYSRLALALLTLFILLGLFLFWLFGHTNNSLQLELTQKLQMNLADYLVKEVSIYKGDQINQTNVKQAFEKVKMLDPATKLYVLDANGNVLAHDQSSSILENKKIDLNPIKTFLNDKSSFPLLGKDPLSDSSKIFSVAPIKGDDDKVKAYLYLTLGSELYNDVAKSPSWNKAWLALGLLLSLLAGLLIFYKMTRPLKRLTQEIDEFESSGFTLLPQRNYEPVHALSEGEKLSDYEQIQGTFYRMGDHINDQLMALHSRDRKRRDFLSHVSNDLRMPLAGIKAYLETLQRKGDSISEDDKKRFIDQALLTHGRLGEMIDEIFEVARLEDGEVKADVETVLIANILHEIQGTLGHYAHQKGVSLLVDEPHKMLTVEADAIKLKRIVYNIVCYALDDCRPGDDITITAKLFCQGQVRVSVRDTGKGISDDEIVHIFDPYHRSDDESLSQAPKKGLGLPIAYRLVGLHKSKLEVQSKENVGTIFSFNIASKSL